MEDNIIWRLITLIIILGIIYFIGAFIAWDTNPIHWWLFTSTLGRIISAILGICILKEVFLED